MNSGGTLKIGRVGRGAGVVLEFRQLAPGDEPVEPQGQRGLRADGLRRAHAQLPRPGHGKRRWHGHGEVAGGAVGELDPGYSPGLVELAAKLAVGRRSGMRRRWRP